MLAGARVHGFARSDGDAFIHNLEFIFTGVRTPKESFGMVNLQVTQTLETARLQVRHALRKTIPNVSPVKNVPHILKPVQHPQCLFCLHQL